MYGRGDWSQHGKPCPVARHAPTGSPRGSGLGRAGWRRGPYYRGGRVTPVEGRGLRWKGWRKGSRLTGVADKAYHPGDEQQFRTSAHAQAKGTTKAVAAVRASTGLMAHRSSRRRGCEPGATARETRPLVATGNPCASRMIPLESPVPYVVISVMWRGCPNRLESSMAADNFTT